MKSPNFILALVLMALLLAACASEGASDSREVVQAIKILKDIELSGQVEYDGKTIEGDLDLSGRDLGPVHFNDTEFRGSVNFFGTKFNDTNFLGAVFSGGDANFEGADFRGDDINFNAAKFNGGDAYFLDAVFSGGDARFMNAEFSGDAYFNCAVFSGGVANFAGAEFIGGDANFAGVNFSGGYAQFSGANFSDFVDFSSAQFSGGYADFKKAQFGRSFGRSYVMFNEAKFSGGDTDFEGANFSSDATFDSAQFSGGNAKFGKTNFGGNVSFEGADFSDNANFEGANFSGNANFKEAEFSKYALFEEASFGEIDRKICLNRTKYERICIKWDSIKDNKLDFDNEAYLKLIKNYRDLGWFEDYNECSYYYRKARDCGSFPEFDWFANKVLCWTYGYGSKPKYPLIWAFLTFLFFWFIWWGVEPELKNEKKVRTPWEALQFNLQVFFSSTKLSVNPPDLVVRKDYWDNEYFSIERAIGSLLFYFFLFAASTSLLIKIV